MLFSKKIKSLFLVLSLNLACLFGVMSEAVALPQNFQDESVVTGLNQPVNLATLPDGRMLVLSKGGEIQIFDPSSIPAAASNYMTIVNIESGEERGLASLVLDPDFATNNYFYVYYTHGSTARNRVSRFSHLGNTGDIASEFMIWQDNENWSDCCHYGGGLDFGPDGKIYLTTGEEFDGNQSPDLTRAGGKIIRINKDGTIPTDNPFYDGAGPNLDEIWAIGLRNPYRAKWDILSEQFFIGDVGGNVQSTAREEINLGQAGRDYGWPAGEGVLNNPAYQDPIYDYDHTSATPNGGAVTAGMMYRGSMFPSQYYGSFFFADYVLGWIKYLEFDVNNQVVAVTDFSTTANNVVSLVEGPEGALYYTDIFGEVRRIVYTSGNQPPVIASVDVVPAAGPSPLSVTFTANATDPEDDTLSYHWIFGDGVEVDGGASISHNYAEGVYTAYVQVSDGTKTSLSNPIAIESGSPPVVQIDTPVFGDLFQALDVISYSGSATDPDETLPASSYSWTIRFLHNAHTHPVLSESIGTSGSVQVNDSGHDYFDSTGFEIILTVTDSAGLTGSDRIEIYPDKVNVNLSTSPGGQNVFLDGVLQATPLVYDTMIGFRHTVSALTSYCDISTDTGYNFSSWSDGGAQTHEITVPSVDMNLVANYVAAGSCVSLVTSGLTMHLESDQGLLVSGSDVTGWVDQSGAGNDLVSSGNPQLVTAADLSDSPVIDFNGINDKLERIGGLTGLPVADNDRTLFLVAKYRGTGFGGFAYGSANCNQAFGAIVDDTGNLSAQGWCPQNDYSSANAGTGAGWLVQSIVLEAGALKHYKEGMLIDSQNHTYNTTLTNMVLGGELADNKFIDMQVAAVLVYNRALTDQERQLTEAYLSDKYFAAETLNIATSSLSDGTINIAYSEFLSVSGGVAPYTWSMASGALPQGLTLDAVTGEISGTPLTTQTANFMVSVSDSVGSSVTSDALLLTIRDGTGNSPATVFISDPLEGDTVVGSDVLVNYSLAGTGYDHLHLTLDSDPHITIMNLTGSYLLSNVAPGAHTITLQLVNSEHTALSNPESNYMVSFIAEAVPNLAPTAVDDSASVDVGASVDIAVLNNDTDSDGSLDNTAVTIVSQPENGTLLDDGNGLLTYIDYGSGVTTDSFTYTVADNLGAVSNVATVSLFIGAQPLVTSGLVMQLEPDQGLSVNSGSVLSWADQSGSGNDLTSAGAPQLVTAVDLNNHKVIDFDGVDDKLERTLTLHGLSSGNANRTVYMYAKYRGTGFGGFAYGAADCNQAFGLIVDSSGNLAVQGWCGGNDFSSSEIGTGTGWQVQSAVLNGGSLTHYKDGVQIDATAHTYNTVLTNMVLGAELNSGKYIDMQVATVLVYDRALDVSEQQQVHDYLNDKYVLNSGGNLTPIANDDSDTVVTAGLVNIAVLDNDSDADGTIDNTTVTVVTPPANGVLVDDGAGLLAYTHDGSATVSDSFTYTVDDNLGAVSNVATVSLTIGNQSPIAVDDSALVDVSASVDIPVLSNDSDPDGTLDNMTVTIMTSPLNGLLVDDGNGLLTYTHDGSATTSDSFTYRVSDNLGAVSNIATVSLLIGAQPIVTNGLVVQLESELGLIVSGSSVLNWSDQSGLGNDMTSSGDPQAVIAADLNNHMVIDFDGVDDKLERTLTLNSLPTGNADRTVYMLAKYRGTGFGGFAYGTAGCNETFGLIVDDSGNLAVQGWCPQNDYSSATVGNGAGWLIQSVVLEAGVMTHYKDGVQIDATAHAYDTVLTNMVLGAELNSGKYIDMQVAAVLVYDRALSTEELQQVDSYLGYGYNLINQAPVALDDGAVVLTSGSIDIAVLTNDSDADGTLDTSSVSIMLPPANGMVIDNGAGLLTYTHDGSATASDSFTYTVMDDLGAVSNTATVTLAINQPPVALDDGAMTITSGSIDIAVLTNDSDADGTLDTTTVSITSPPVNGMVIDDGSGLLTYTHDGSPTAVDSFTYTVMDDLGAVSNTATVTLAINQPPVTMNDGATVDNAGSVDIAVLTNDSDADGTLDSTTVAIVMLPLNGTIFDDGAGLLTYSHDGSSTLSDSFTYTVMDDLGAVSNIATVAITVNAIIPNGDVAPFGASDGQLNAADVLVMTRIVLGEIAPTAQTIEKGDIYPPGSPDGVIDISDLILLQQLVLSGAGI